MRESVAWGDREVQALTGWRWAPASGGASANAADASEASGANPVRFAFVVFIAVLAIKFVVGRMMFDLDAMTGNPWAFGFEVGHIAGNVASGHGFSISREPGVHVPTAWISPLYPLMLAMIFKLYGLYTLAAAQAMFLANCVFQAATASLLYLLGARFGGRNVGLVAAAIFLVNPNGWQFLGWAWPSQLFALLVLLHVHALLVPAKKTLVAAGWVGATFGLALMADGAAIAIAPVTLIHLVVANTRSDRRMAIASASLCFFIVVAPWTIRNAEQFGSFNPLRGNVGVNLWVGNYPGANEEAFHGLAPSPWHNTEQGERFTALGEQQYDRAARAQAFDVIADDPMRFIGNSVMRFAGFWIGEFWTGYSHIAWTYSLGLIALSALALRGAIRARTLGTGALLAVLLLFGGPYYLTVHGHGRYRVPVEPLMCLLAALKPGETRENFRDEVV